MGTASVIEKARGLVLIDYAASEEKLVSRELSYEH